MEAFANLDGDLLPDCADDDADGDGFTVVQGDCADLDATRYPGAPEVADDGIDQDCDGSDTVTCFVDGDLDGWGSGSTLLSADGDCLDLGESTATGDCNDGSAAIHPAAAEVCNAIDDNCDGLRDPTGTCEACIQATHAGHVYQFCYVTDRSWAGSRDWCTARGYYLTTIDNAAENSFLWTGTAVQSGQKWHMGFNDRAQEGNWQWVGAASTSSYTNWHSGEPNNAGNEDCGQLRRFSTATWNDEPCNQSLNYICEAN